MMSTCVSGANAVPPAPTYATVTLYGPPTLMPGIENRPSARVTASYVVPDGSWIAITLAPATGSCWVLVTMPVTAPVVTPWASACSAGHSSVHTAKRVTNPRIYVILLSAESACRLGNELGGQTYQSNVTAAWTATPLALMPAELYMKRAA